ncbi:hypothetical protein K491DRAFT_693529 [Lophiostoma macrostomum CBS 122681]|uniref:KANL3/Tex30 alpha/beta hydrolase-like domain-containing protein n=1 Tax=Lophiostoma macrostomum CBS 122681 TaxID=1314788 RepID=A0A6A6T3R2_9PLEO|nr:hypothetical protein K491DRAFT_693529 [Lophiostoma macrostomum CBS 122681]
MPPKRRKVTEPSDAPPSKKHRTRSSTKSRPPVQSSPDDEPAISNIPKSHREKSNPKAKPSNAKSKDSKDSAFVDRKASPNPTSNSPTSFSINTPDLKKPIQCQTYTPQNTAGSSKTKTASSNETLIYTHGAGGTLSAPAVVHFCTGFSSPSASSIPILAFQGSMNLAARVKGFHACIDHVSSQGQDGVGKEKKNKKENGNGNGNGDGNAKRLLLGGRSMGARAAVIAATEALQSNKQEEQNIDLVLASYPLRGPKSLRDEILIALPENVRVLFMIGSKDSMCPLDLLNEVREKMEAQTWLVTVEGLDHGMRGKGERELGEWSGRVALEWVVGEWGDSEKGRVLRLGEREVDGT